GPEAGYHARGGLRGARDAPVRLSRVDVRDVHLDHRAGEGAQSVGKREARVAQAAGIYDTAVGPRSLGFEDVDQLSLVIALRETADDAQLRGTLSHRGLDVGQRGSAVQLGLAGAERPEVRPVEHQDPGHARTWLSAVHTASSGTSWPKRGRPRRSSRTQPTPSSCAFLSAAIDRITADGSTRGMRSSPARRSTSSCHARCGAGQPRAPTLSFPATRMPAAIASP